MKILFVCALTDETDNSNNLFGYPIIYTGVGKINASHKLTLGIEKYKPELICNFGSCGSFYKEVGELVKVKMVYNGDMDAEPLCNYSITPFDKNGSEFTLSDDGEDCFSSDMFITKNKLLSFSDNKLHLFKKSQIFDMELYAMAKVSFEMGVKLISYKWVSDDGSFHDWKKNCEIGFNNFKKLFIEKHM